MYYVYKSHLITIEQGFSTSLSPSCCSENCWEFCVAFWVN